MKTLVYIIFFCTAVCVAQTKISGKVMDGKWTIFAANVYLQSSPETGTITDENGLFSIVIPNENDTLIISYIGYKELYIPTANLLKDELNVFNLQLKAEVLQQVVLENRDPISEQFSVVKLDKMDIYLNPVAQGDPLKAITILPASTNVDETANPSLRGSDPDRSRVILNGVPVYNPVRASQINNQGFFSLFNPEIIGKQYVYASNPPLVYGNSSAGLVEIQTTKSLEKDQLKLSATLVSTGFLVSQQLDSINSFVQVYGNYQLSDAFLGIQERNLPNLQDFTTLDFGVNAGFQLKNNWFLNTYTYFIDEDFLGTDQRFTYRGQFTSAKRRLFTVNSIGHAIGNGFLSFNTGFNTESQDFAFGNAISDQETQQLYAGLNYKLKLDDFTVQSVVSVDHQTNNFDDINPEIFYALSPESPTQTSQRSLDNTAVEAAVYGSWKPNNDITISSGIRANAPTDAQSSFVSWQFGARYNLNNKHAFLLSGGKYHNYTTPSFFRQRFDLLRSEQIALDYTYEAKKTSISGAVYYKTEGGRRPIIGGLSIDEQETFGVELFVKQQLHPYLSISASYSYIDQQFSLGDTQYPGSRDADYFIKSTLEFKHPRWCTLSLNWIGRTGTNYTGIVGGTPGVNTNFFQPVFSENLLGDRFTDYSRLDLNVSKYITWKDKELVLFASINNVFNQQNQRIDQYNADYSVRTFDVFQRRLFFFGMVWTLNH
ncbi:MAG: carboxypeptidase-like regulatory domain-containing protein [Bacteroidota bacterium]